MSLDNKVLELRLVTKDTAIGQASSLGRCAAKLNALKSCSNAETSKTAIAGFIREILMYRLDLNKSCRLLCSSDDQLAEYDRLERIVQESIDKTKQEIYSLTIELKQEQDIRKHRIHIESIATEVNQHSSLSSLKRKINEITESMTSTTESMQSIENDIMTRKEQLDQLEQILTTLETKLQHDYDAGLDEIEGVDPDGEDWDAGRDDGGANDFKPVNNNDSYAEAGEIIEESGEIVEEELQNEI